MKEIWKDINNYNGLYQVSNFGNVRSFNNYNKISNQRLLKFNVRQGYNTVQLSNKQERHSYQVHRLVAEAFIPNPNNYPFVNHIDENRKNNNVNNLEWCTQKMNVNHSKRKLQKLKNICHSSTNEKYIYYRFENNSKHYRVCIAQLKIDRRFKTLNDAIIFRNYQLEKLHKLY